MRCVDALMQTSRVVERTVAEGLQELPSGASALLLEFSTTVLQSSSSPCGAPCSYIGSPFCILPWDVQPMNRASLKLASTGQCSATSN